MMNVLVKTNHRVKILEVMELEIKLGLRNNKKVYFHILGVEEFSFDNNKSIA